MKKVSIKHYMAAGYPAIAVQTSDEDRLISSLCNMFPKRPIARIAASGGLIDARTSNVIDTTKKENLATLSEQMRAYFNLTNHAITGKQYGYPQAFQLATTMHTRPQGAERLENPFIVVALDYQHSMKTGAQYYRILRDTLPAIKAAKGLLVLVAPNWSLPAEIEHDIARFVDELPTRNELNAALEVCVSATDTKLDADMRKRLLDSATGLTLAEAENSFALSFAAEGAYVPEYVSEEKMKLLKQSGTCEIIKPASRNDIGGYRGFVDCIENEVMPSADDIETMVGGIVADGVQGTGKSLGARILSGFTGYPIMRVDMAALKAASGGIVGQSENRILDAFKKARACAPIIMFFDEIEKGFRGAKSANDAGVSSGMSGIFLTQTQEIMDNGEKVLLYATSNDLNALPSEISRRFEIQFFFDVPKFSERVEIARVFLRKLAPNALTAAESIAPMTDTWTGDEIQRLIRMSVRRARRQYKKEQVTAEILLQYVPDAHAGIKPITSTRKDEIETLREFGRNNLRCANSPDDSAPVVETAKAKRSIETLHPDSIAAEIAKRGTVN